MSRKGSGVRMQGFSRQEGTQAATGLLIVRLALGGREGAVFCACVRVGYFAHL